MTYRKVFPQFVPKFDLHLVSGHSELVSPDGINAVIPTPLHLVTGALDTRVLERRDKVRVLHVTILESEALCELLKGLV